MKNILVSMICGLIGAIVFSLGNNYLYARPVAVVKLDEILGDHLKKYGEQELSEEERQEVSEKFGRLLNSTIQKVSEEYRVTLLVAPAVISDVPDYTALINSEIERSMNGD